MATVKLKDAQINKILNRYRPQIYSAERNIVSKITPAMLAAAIRAGDNLTHCYSQDDANLITVKLSMDFSKNSDFILNTQGECVSIDIVLGQLPAELEYASYIEATVVLTFLASIAAADGYFKYWDEQHNPLEEKPCPETIFWDSIRPSEKDIKFAKSLRFAGSDFAYEMYA